MITKIEKETIPCKKTRANDVSRDIIEFDKSGWDACEVTYTQKTVHAAHSAYYAACKRLKLGVSVLLRDGKLYLVRG